MSFGERGLSIVLISGLLCIAVLGYMFIDEYYNYYIDFAYNETYTKTVTDVWINSKTIRPDKVTFSDGEILFATGVSRFKWKLGAEHNITVGVTDSGWREIKKVEIVKNK